MDRALPEYNRIMVKHEHDKKRRMHKDKLKSMTPRIDNAVPSVLNLPRTSAKRDFMVESRCQEIERQNKRLLQRMENILLGKPKDDIPG